MANEEHLKILKQGVEVWNKWREENPDIKPDLCKADLSQTDLSKADLNWADLTGANLFGSDLYKADLACAKLSKAHLEHSNLERSDLISTNLCMAFLCGANLERANLTAVILEGADLSRANLNMTLIIEARLRGANLDGANLQGAVLARTDLSAAILNRCKVYGTSAWDLELTNAEQTDLVITNKYQPVITVDNLEVAQFVYLLLNRKKLRNVIDTITSKLVLILGRFTPERKAILDSMASELRKHNLLPIIFDFERASSRDFTETIKTLAGMSLFVIADITNPSSAPLELQAIVPDYQIPFVPILQEGEKPFAMFCDLKAKYSWVLPLLPYPSPKILLKIFKGAIIDEAFEMHKKLLKLKAGAMETRSAEDYLKESE